MYSRSCYNENDDTLKLPENYNGTAFGEKEETALEKDSKECAFELQEEKSERQNKSEGAFSFLQKGSPVGAFLSKWLPYPISFPKIGTEEILIIAAAAYLFFTKEGDKECAVMLILLLLVN